MDNELTFFDGLRRKINPVLSIEDKWSSAIFIWFPGNFTFINPSEKDFSLSITRAFTAFRGQYHYKMNLNSRYLTVG